MPVRQLCVALPVKCTSRHEDALVFNYRARSPHLHLSDSITGIHTFTLRRMQHMCQAIIVQHRIPLSLSHVIPPSSDVMFPNP